MTITDVLRINGVNTPRFASPTGRLQFQTEPSRVEGLPLKSHTFHGGEDVEVEEDAQNCWWMSDGSMELERASMAKWFPSFTEYAGDENSPPAWGGTIDTGRRKFNVLFLHRWDRGLPRVIPVTPKSLKRQFGYRVVNSPPHIYTSGNLCVASEEDWDPEGDDMTTVIAWTTHWLANYVEWTFTGKWPSEGYQSLVA